MIPDSNLILTGFMGTGKTTVGQLVAEKLGREFVDTDLATPRVTTAFRCQDRYGLGGPPR